MAWQDRIRKGSYSAPSGEIINFDFADVRVEIDKKTTTYTFANVDGAYVQDNGSGAATYPMRIFIAGADYDQIADNLVRLLSERGAGKLTHPKYGQKTVVPTQIRRRDDLVTGAGQAVFDVPFVETLTQLFPRGLQDESAKSNFLIDQFDSQSPAAFDQNIVAISSSEKENFKADSNEAVNKINNALRQMADQSENVIRNFDAAVTGLKNGISFYANRPSDMAVQLNRLIRLPGLAQNSLKSALNYFSGLINGQAENLTQTIDNTARNDFNLRKLVAYSALSSMADFTVNRASYQSRKDAIYAADFLAEEFSFVDSWESDQAKNLGVIDYGVIYQPVQELISVESGRLVSKTYDLPLERRFFTDRTRNIVELAAKLYGNADDDTINLLIDTNNFVGPDLIQIPKGREVVYFK